MEEGEGEAIYVCVRGGPAGRPARAGHCPRAHARMCARGEKNGWCFAP